jgi:hypothetical protein
MTIRPIHLALHASRCLGVAGAMVGRCKLSLRNQGFSPPGESMS